MTTIQVDKVHRVELPDGYDEDNSLVVSSTQVETYDLCSRKWWFTWPLQMPQPPESDSLLFGTRLHACLAAWQLGEDPPDGWEVGLAPRDADLISRFVQVAVDTHMIERVPGQLVEKHFLRLLADVEVGPSRTIRVFVCGMSDVIRPETAEVHDHKSAIDARWLKSDKRRVKCRTCPGETCRRCGGTGEHDNERYLGRSRQVLIYAREMLVQREERGLLLPDEVKLRHNGFVRDYDRPIARATDVVVSVAEVMSHWNRLVEEVRDYVLLREGHRDPSLWYTVAGPEDPGRACSAFAGCAYRLVCGGRWTVQQYRNHYAKEKDQMSNPSPFGPATAPPVGQPTVNGPTGNGTDYFRVAIGTAKQPDNYPRARVQEMIDQQGTALFGTIKVWRPGLAGWVSPLEQGFRAPQDDVPALDAAEQTPPFGTSQPPKPAPPPWHQPNCQACSGNQRPGYNSEGHPCRICDQNASRTPGGTPSHFYDVTVGANGLTTYQLKPEHTHPPQAPAPPIQQPTPGATQAPIEVQQRTEAAPGAAAAPAKRGRGRPRKDGGIAPVDKAATPIGSGAIVLQGFVLCINAVPLLPEEQRERIVDLADVLDEWGQKLAASTNPPARSYYSMHAFDRRDRLAEVAATIAGELAGTVVVVGGRSPDMTALCDALRPFAAMVVQGGGA